MKKIYLALIAVVIATPIFLMATSSPFPPWINKFTGDITANKYGVTAIGSDKVTGDQITEQAAAGQALYGAKIARFIYDVAVDGGTINIPRNLGVTLPAKAVITRSYVKIITQFADSGAGTVKISCIGAGDVLPDADYTGSSANAFIEGASTGTAATFVRGISSGCTISAFTHGVSPSTGKLVGWVHYVVEN